MNYFEELRRSYGKLVTVSSCYFIFSKPANPDYPSELNLILKQGEPVLIADNEKILNIYRKYSQFDEDCSNWWIIGCTPVGLTEMSISAISSSLQQIKCYLGWDQSKLTVFHPQLGQNKAIQLKVKAGKILLRNRLIDGNRVVFDKNIYWSILNN